MTFFKILVLTALVVIHFNNILTADDCFSAFPPDWQEYFVVLNDKEKTLDKTLEKKIQMSVKMKREGNSLFIDVIDWKSVMEEDGVKIFDAKEYINIIPKLKIKKQNPIVIELDKDLQVNTETMNNTPDLFFNFYMVKTIPLQLYTDNRFQETSKIKIEDIPIQCKNKIVLPDDSTLVSIESKGSYNYKDNMERIMLGKISFEMSISYSKTNKMMTKCSYLFTKKKKSRSRELVFKMEAK